MTNMKKTLLFVAALSAAAAAYLTFTHLTVRHSSSKRSININDGLVAERISAFKQPRVIYLSEGPTEGFFTSVFTDAAKGGALQRGPVATDRIEKLLKEIRGLQYARVDNPPIRNELSRVAEGNFTYVDVVLEDELGSRVASYNGGALIYFIFSGGDRIAYVLWDGKNPTAE